MTETKIYKTMNCVSKEDYKRFFDKKFDMDTEVEHETFLMIDTWGINFEKNKGTAYYDLAWDCDELNLCGEKYNINTSSYFALASCGWEWEDYYNYSEDEDEDEEEAPPPYENDKTWYINGSGKKCKIIKKCKNEVICNHKWECGCKKSTCFEMNGYDCKEDIMCDNEKCKFYYDSRNDNCDCGDRDCMYCNEDM
jgi:hypothetical protein